MLGVSASHRRAIGACRFRDCKQRRNHIAGVPATLSKIGVADIQEPCHHPIGERGGLRHDLQIAAPDRCALHPGIAPRQRARLFAQGFVVGAYSAGESVDQAQLARVYRPGIERRVFGMHREIDEPVGGRVHAVLVA